MQDDDERTLRFHTLYSAVLSQTLDRDEFVADDLYAFQALERAMRGDNQELRNLAAHLQARRQAAMESITLKSNERLDNTRRLPTLPPAAVPAAADGLPEMLQQPDPPRGERRAGTPELSPQAATRVTYFERLYRLEFGRPLNVTRFKLDDVYGREILKEALGSANQELVALAKHFVDEHGKPRQHRRGEQPVTQ
ncbi:MAG: hypothetical protein JWN73_662 [Betaproteobacteria bacterium]|nr:hypothetical protein [Betaproteobacteria bacterium]